MKKKIICLFCLGVLLFITGCGKEKAVVTNNGSSNSTCSGEKKVEKTYYCVQDKEDDFEYYFKYINDELTNVKFIANNMVEKDYTKFKKNATKYEGIIVSKKDGKVEIDMDLSKNGYDFLVKEFETFKDLEFSDWEYVSKEIQKENYKCMEQK